MKRVVVHLLADFAAKFAEGTGMSFFDATTSVLKKTFGENSTKTIRQDEYNFELEVDEGNNDVSSNALVNFLAENLGIKEALGGPVIISCFSVRAMPSLFVKKKKNANFVSEMGRFKDFKDLLSNAVRGQEYAVNTVVKGFIDAKTFQDTKDKPKLTFFFAGEEKTGKTMLAREACKHLEIPYLELNALDYESDKAAEKLFPFVNNNPNGAVIFNDIEAFDKKMTTILFIAYSTGAVDGLSFRGLTIFFTTRCGRSLYENSRPNLSHLSAQDILEACGKDPNPLDPRAPLLHPQFLDVISNEHIVMFNHLQTVDYQNIISEALKAHVEKLRLRTEIQCDLNVDDFARFAMYQNPDERNIDKLVNFAKDLINKEIQQLLLQTNKENGESLLLNVTDIEFKIDYQKASPEVASLFENKQYYLAIVTKDKDVFAELEKDGYKVNFVETVEQMKECFDKEEADVILLDPTFGVRGEEQLIDIEDFDSVGMDIFNYVKRYHGNVALDLISNSKEQRYSGAYQTLIDAGADKLIYYSSEDITNIQNDVCALVMSFELDRDINFLRKNNLHLDFNPHQEFKDNKVIVSFSKLELRQVSLNVFDVDNGDYHNIKGFDDVIGCTVAKESLRQYSKYLSNTSEYLESGAVPPKLILLESPRVGRNKFASGGKTALVRALAEETGASLQYVDFKKVLINGKDPVESIREVFKKARYTAPSVIHFDNINVAIEPGENQLTFRILEALNAELAYCVKDTVHPIIAIGECDPHYGMNDKLVETCTRKFTLTVPNIDEIEQFIRLYFKEKHITTVSEKGIKNFSKRASSQYSFVEVARLLDFIVSYAGSRPIDDQLLKEGFDIKYNGDIDNSIITEDWLLTVSYHEIGHYLLLRLFGEHPTFVTVVPRADYGGYTEHEATDENRMTTKQDLLNRICVSFGGRAGELLKNGEEKGMTTGISSDIQNATFVARAMVAAFAMGDNLAAYPDLNELSLNSQEVYANVNKILKEQFERSVRLIKLNEENMKILSYALKDNKSMTGDELEELLPDDKLIYEK